MSAKPPLSESQRFWESIWLYGIVAVDETPPYEGMTYVALFTMGERMTALALTDSGIAGMGGGGPCATPDIVPFVRSIDTWLLPPLYPFPPE